jgi:GGDEF domain-containing protein
MVTCCRTDRRELSLLLVEIDNYDQLVRSGGVAVARRFAARLDASLSTSDLGDAVMLPMTAARFALLLPGSDRTAAVVLGRQLIAATVAFSADQSPHDRLVPKLSIGLATVAVPPKNFSARALIDSAQRCLHAARSSRKNAIKSIEVY